MLVLGIESSCDETGVALYEHVTGRRDYRAGLLAQALHSQIGMHAEYGGVVPELASRDHIRRVLPLARQALADAARTLGQVDGIAFTQGPGLAGALLVGASVATALGFALRVPVVGVHHLEGHLLSPLLADDPPDFPFVALLVSGGHTQLMRVSGLGEYALLGETMDDAAGEAFDKTAQLLGLGYPGGPALAALAAGGEPGRLRLPRPLLGGGGLDFSFSGLKTAVSLASRSEAAHATADIAAEFQEAVVDVLVAKALAACAASDLDTLVVAGGVGANQRLRERLSAAAGATGIRVHYPEAALCTDNGAMIAFAGALRLASSSAGDYGFSVRPRWDLESLTAP
ncbi:MAG: tRNA (adenosine(37)-N6)-threonylcarbamoyltransferase complex transferase subunit TsaD [Burkholderiales bacterium]|nr:tRNA (adenosine(37)-N6)-threonylcarbamoyltransferase complex transferase subunit TsaD [Burkholderiales bacterium]